MGRLNILLVIVAALFSTVGAEDVERFDPDKHADFLELIPQTEKEEILSALEDAAANYRELVDAVQLVDEDKKGDLIWLIQRIPHLDRLTVTARILLEHVSYAFDCKQRFKYQVPEELFREFILTYRIGSEPVQAWRRKLFETFYPSIKEKPNPTEAAKTVNRWVQRNIKTRPKEFFGEVQPPLMTLKGKKGTEEEIAILTTAILKSLGIPGRRVRVSCFGEQEGGASWVEIYDQGKWIPLYPLDPGDSGDFSKFERRHPRNITLVHTRAGNQRSLITPGYTPTGSLRVCITEGLEPKIDFEDLSVSVFNGGSLCPLDELSFGYEDEELSTDSSGCLGVELGDGIYYVQAGVRDSLGNPWVVIQRAVVEPGKTTDLKLEIVPR